MRILEPKIIILDEIDSGLDVDAFQMMKKLFTSLPNPQPTFIVITHNFRFTEILPPDQVIILESGKVAEVSGKELMTKIGEKGFSDLHSSNSPLSA